jgi:hypothetical protein
MYKRIITYVINIIFCVTANISVSQLTYSLESLQYAKGTIKERNLFKNRLLKNINQLVLADTTQKINSSTWSKGLWAMTYLLDSNHTNSQFLTYALSKYFSLSTFLQQQLLETVYTIEPKKITATLVVIAQQDTVLKHLLMCNAYAKRNGNTQIEALLPKYNYTNLALYEAYNFDIKHNKPLTQSQIQSIVFSNTATTYPYIISLQPKHRNSEGIALIKNVDGHFIKDSVTQKPIIIPQLARSINALPWYISNGNTPQGIYAILGTGMSNIELIGKTPNLQLLMPCECPAYRFLHSNDSSDIVLSADNLIAHFPFLKEGTGLLESYYASKAGRTEIIAHGTTTNPEYYRNKMYYPNTPTMGCLSAAEIYDGGTGKCTQSNQLILVNYFLKTGFTKGYLLVIDVDDIDYWIKTIH